MNSTTTRDVGPAVLPHGALLALAMGLAGIMSGCVDIDGGAVELSWSIRTAGGQPSDCELRNPDTPDVEEVWICWAAQGQTTDACFTGDGAEPARFAAFPCQDEHGVTGFEIESGPTLIWVQPVCSAQRLPPLDRVEVPPPILRDMVEGQVAALNALLILAEDDACQL